MSYDDDGSAVRCVRFDYARQRGCVAGQALRALVVGQWLALAVWVARLRPGHMRRVQQPRRHIGPLSVPVRALCDGKVRKRALILQPAMSKDLSELPFNLDCFSESLSEWSRSLQSATSRQKSGPAGESRGQLGTRRAGPEPASVL